MVSIMRASLSPGATRVSAEAPKIHSSAFIVDMLLSEYLMLYPLNTPHAPMVDFTFIFIHHF